MNLKNKILLILLLISAAGRGYADLLIGPFAYKAGDRPFGDTSAFAYWYLENFDSDLTLAKGVSLSGNGRRLAPSDATDSVDGPGTHSFYPNAPSVTFSFDPNSPALNGKLPTHVGLVWTDIGFNLDFSTTYIGNVRFEAFDQNGASLGIIGPQPAGDGTTSSSNTADDVFFGVFHRDGISSVTISMDNSEDWEIDDLQFGYLPPVDNSGNPTPIPTPIPTPTPTPGPNPNPGNDPSAPPPGACTDKKRPVIKMQRRFNRPSLAVRKPLEILGTVSDDCKIAAVNIFLKQDLVYSSTSDTIRYTLNPLRFKNGVYPVRVAAQDTAGNLRTKRFKAKIKISKARRAQLSNTPRQ